MFADALLPEDQRTALHEKSMQSAAAAIKADRARPGFSRGCTPWNMTPPTPEDLERLEHETNCNVMYSPRMMGRGELQYSFKRKAPATRDER